MGTEQLRRRTPLGPLADELRAVCVSERFACREDGFRTLTELRSSPQGRVELESALGIEMPGIGGVAVTESTDVAGSAYVVGLGPHWWLVDGPEDSSPASRSSARVMAVDVSAQRTTLLLSGSAVTDVLGHGTSLDVHRDVFPVGAAAQTVLAKAGVILARTTPDEYRVWVRASFARYLAEWVIDASLEYR
jgi:sarcosine oxidase subunit gamma